MNMSKPNQCLDKNVDTDGALDSDQFYPAFQGCSRLDPEGNSYISLSYDVAVIQWITSCHK